MRNKLSPEEISLKKMGMKKALLSIVNNRTIVSVKQIESDDDGIIVFLDETGNEKPSKGLPYLGFAGCAFAYNNYDDNVSSSWNVIRKEVFRLTAQQHFHATSYMHAATSEEIVRVASLLRKVNYIPVVSFYVFQMPAAFDYHHTKIALLSAISMIISHVEQQFPKSLNKVSYIFEKSEKISWRILHHCLGGESILHGIDVGSTFFMEKDSKEPGMEMADLIAWLSGRNFANNFNSDISLGRYHDLYNAALSPWSLTENEQTLTLTS